jgi:hypothetical protein
MNSYLCIGVNRLPMLNVYNSFIKLLKLGFTNMHTNFNDRTKFSIVFFSFCSEFSSEPERILWRRRTRLRPSNVAKRDFRHKTERKRDESRKKRRASLTRSLRHYQVEILFTIDTSFLLSFAKLLTMGKIDYILHLKWMN